MHRGKGHQYYDPKQSKSPMKKHPFERPGYKLF